jgi:hypothetical protein
MRISVSRIDSHRIGPAVGALAMVTLRFSR